MKLINKILSWIVLFFCPFFIQNTKAESFCNNLKEVISKIDNIEDLSTQKVSKATPIELEGKIKVSGFQDCGIWSPRISDGKKEYMCNSSIFTDEITSSNLYNELTSNIFTCLNFTEWNHFKDTPNGEKMTMATNKATGVNTTLFVNVLSRFVGGLPKELGGNGEEISVWQVSMQISHRKK